MKVLVTGGLGFIGSHTVVELCNKEFLEKSGIADDYEIVVIDNCSYCKEKPRNFYFLFKNLNFQKHFYLMNY